MGATITVRKWSCISGGDTTTLIFNSLTGLITKICVKTGDVTTCTADKAQLVSGFIRLALPPTYPNLPSVNDAQSLDPQSTVAELNTLLKLGNKQLEDVFRGILEDCSLEKVQALEYVAKSMLIYIIGRNLLTLDR